MKKFLAATTALTLLTGAFASCGKPVPTASSDPSNDAISAQNTEATAEASPEQLAAKKRISNGMYKYTTISVPFRYDYMYGLEKISDNMFSLTYVSPDTSEGHTVITDRDFKDFAEIQYDIPEEIKQYDSYYHMPYYAPDGSFVTLVTAEDHGGLIPPDDSEDYENFDWDAYYENTTSHYYACSYDRDGQLLSYSEVEFPEEFFDHGFVNISGILSVNDQILAMVGYNQLLRINPSDGSYTELYREETDNRYYYTEYYLSYDRDGKPLFIKQNNEENDEGFISYSWDIYEVNDNGLSPDPICNSDCCATNGSPVSAGYGEYRLLLTKDDGLYGLKDDLSEQLIVNWNNSGISPMNLCPIGDDEFVSLRVEYNTDGQGAASYTLIHLVPRNLSELENTNIITIGCPAIYGFNQDIINKYNNSQDKNHVELITYGEVNYDELDYSTMEENAYKEFERALISGEIPDIVAGISYPKLINLSKKGVFADLGEFMDKDTQYGRKAFVPSVIECLSSDDGKLYTITTGFSVDSKLIKTKFWDKPTWTLDDVINLYDSHEDIAIHLYDGDTNRDMLYNMANTLDGLIDYEKGTCEFNSPEFIKVLEFCNRFGDEYDRPDKGIDGADAVQDYWTDRFTWFARDYVLTLNCSAEGVRYCMSKYLEGGGEDMIFVGYPSDSGSGGRIAIYDFMSICSSSDNKDAAWDFITYAIGYGSMNGGYSPLMKVFDDQVYSEVGAEHTASGNPIPPETKEEANMIRDYILSCSTIENFFPDALWQIIDEEAGEYFTGAITAEEAAARIQNRAEIYISENQ